MNAVLLSIGWALDGVGVVAISWLAVRWLAAELRGLDLLLAWGLAALTAVAGAGVLLGSTGGLGLAGFLAVHLVLLGLLGWLRRGQGVADARALSALGRDLRQDWLTTPTEIGLAGVVAVVLAFSLVAAVAAQPVVFDALTYRLSRVGHWLQAGRIVTIATDDARLNYMSVVPDLVTAWILTARSADFAAVALVQFFGGLLALGATLGLGRLTGLSRAASLAAAGLLLGLPNVAPQFTAAYTDLFTTGVLAAGYYLWLAALRRGEGSWWGGVAAGLALGAKGTVAYFAPGLLLATGWLAWRHRVGFAAWRRTLTGALLAVAVFVGPWLARNQEAYGHLLGPEEFVTWHQGKTPDLSGSVDKLRLNLNSAAAQLCEPSSQPPWWRGAIRRAGEAIIPTLPTQDPYAFDGIDRRANLEKIYAVTAPDADVASTGVLLPLLAVFGAAAAWLRRKTPDGELALVWAVALAVFVVFLHWRLQWHPYLFRFLVLGAPWLAVLAVWFLQLQASRVRAVAWVVVGATTLTGLQGALFNTYQSGWPAVVHAEQSVGSYVFARWRAWAATLDRPGEPVRPAMIVNMPLAAFYRQEARREVQPGRLSALTAPTAEAAVTAGGGWLVVPAEKFLGHEGRVMVRTWLFQGEERHPFSIAAFRALQPGEPVLPVLYRNRVVPTEQGRRRELLVRAGSAAAIRLELGNPGPVAARCVVHAAGGEVTQELGPHARLWLELTLPPETVAPVSVDFPASGAEIEARLGL
jgi:hypothetical protein